MAQPIASLIGRDVLVVVSDPWEMVDEAKSNRLEGTIATAQPFSEMVERESILVDLTAPVVSRSTTYRSLLLEARHGEGLVDLLSERDDVQCNFVGITERQRNRPDVLDMTAWRGGLAGIAALRLIE